MVLDKETIMPVSPEKHFPRLDMESSVAALVPHYRCEEWLPDCLESLVAQTRPLQAIIVIDDASEEPPLDIVRRFPQVTLLAAEENVGPYRLIQQVIDDTNFDAYLLNDADDWSATDRLRILLAEASRTGAELIGGQEIRILCNAAEVVFSRYPVDVNAALREHPTCFPLLHPTSMVARSLVTRIGGFATGMRFSGDEEFLRRACHVARVVNVTKYLYFRRKRTNALTTAPETGFGSQARRDSQGLLRKRATENAQAVKTGKCPNLAPLELAPSVPLRLLLGPNIKNVLETAY